MENVWFKSPMEYSPDGKGIIVPMEYTHMVYNPNGKAWFYERLFFLVVIATVKDKKKYRIKDTMSIKTNFMH